MWGEFVVGSLLAPTVVSPGTPVFPFPQKHFSRHSNSIRNPRATSFSVARLSSATLVQGVVSPIFSITVKSQNTYVYRCKAKNYDPVLLNGYSIAQKLNKCVWLR